MRLIAATLVFGLAWATNLQADLLDFEDLGLANNAPIPQEYGDTALVDVSYQVLDSFGGDGIQQESSLPFWDSGYGDLLNVAWGTDNVQTNVGEVKLAATSGYTIELYSLNLGGWNGDQTGRTVRIYDENWDVLREYTDQTILGTSSEHSAFSPNVSAATVTIQWDYPWGVAIDDISFSSVPEPSAMTLCLIGGVLAGFFYWRRR